MDKKRNVIQVYAIIVNVVAVITFIIASGNFIAALIDRNDPLYGGYSQVDLSSYQKYKMDVLKSTSKEAAYIPTDQEIMDMYESAREGKINKVRHESFKNMVVSSIIILISLVLFGFHWRLIKKYDLKPES